MQTSQFSTTALIEQMVDQLRKNGTIVSQSHDVATGILTVELTDLFDLAVHKYIQIGGVDYRIIAVTPADPPTTPFPLVQIETVGVLAETTYKTPYPYFHKGTFQMINQKVTETGDPFTVLPAVLLLKIYNDERITDRTSVLSRRPRIRMAMIDASDPDWNDVQHEPLLDSLEDVAVTFVDDIVYNNQFVQRLKDPYRLVRHLNYGVFVDSQGNKSVMINSEVDACTVEFDMPIFVSIDKCKKDAIELATCSPVVIYDGSGNVLQVEPAGGSYVDEDTLNTLISFPSASADTVTVTVISAVVGTYTAEVLDNVDTILYEIDTGSGFTPATIPFILNLNDDFRVTITRTAPGDASSLITA